MPEEGKQINGTPARIQAAAPQNLFRIQARNSHTTEYGDHRFTRICDTGSLRISQEILEAVGGGRPSLELKKGHQNLRILPTSLARMHRQCKTSHGEGKA